MAASSATHRNLAHSGRKCRNSTGIRVEMEISGYQASPLTGPEAVCTFHELEQRAQKPVQGPSLIEPRD